MESILSSLQTSDYSEEAFVPSSQSSHYSFWAYFIIRKSYLLKLSFSHDDLDR